MFRYEVTREDVEQRIETRKFLGLPDKITLDDILEIYGPPVILWRKLDNDEETAEVLLELIAKLVMEAIPQNECNTRAARIIRVPFRRIDMSGAPVC